MSLEDDLYEQRIRRIAEIEALGFRAYGRRFDFSHTIPQILTEHGELRFTRIAEQLEGISQKMLTKTLRQMERDGLLERTVHPVVPPHVDYRLTELGFSLGAAFCGVWMWAEKHREAVQRARARFDAAPVAGVPRPRGVI